MKILHVITSLLYGGAEKLVAEIAPMIRDKGHEVDVLAFSGAEPNFMHLLEEKGIRVYTFTEKAEYYSPRFLWRLTRMMRHYDIVHTHNTFPQLFAAIGSLWLQVSGCFMFKKVSGPRLVTTEHNTNNRRRGIPVLKWADRWMYGRYDRIICISDKAEANLREYLPELKGVCTIYNGVNVRKFHEAKAIEDLHPEGKTVVVMVAAFRPQKDQKTLIDAMALLPVEQYELWIVGDGELHDELHAYAAPYGNVKFFGNRPDVPEVLHSADIVVMSSHYEGLSLSSVEGMAVGKPFVASDVDGLHEVVDGYGVLVPHQDAKALAETIKNLTEDKAYRQQVADRCWERAQMFDIEKMVGRYNEVYGSLS